MVTRREAETGKPMSMENPKIIAGSFAPLYVGDNVSVPQLMTKWNPDNVPPEKVVHADTISGKVITYGGLRAEAARCAWGLQKKLGLKTGAVVCVLVPNSTDFIVLAHATWWAGAIFSPLNPSYTVSDIAHSIDLVRPTHIAVAGPYVKSTQEALRVSKFGREDSASPPQIFTVLDQCDGLLKFPEDITGTTSDEAIQPYDLAGKSAKEAVAVICFSSGTTGKMKGVQLSHYNLVQNVMQYRASIPQMSNSSSREIFFPPYCHIYGLSTVVLLGMFVGNFSCGMPAFELEDFCRQMAKHKATWVHLVPPVALLLASAEVIDKYDFSSLRYIVVAAAPLKPSLQSRLKSRFPQTAVLQGYGLSECSPAVTFQHENDESSVGTIGRLFSGTEARLVDPASGLDVDKGEEGELWVRGPQVMVGYIGDEAATRSAFSGDWLRTGDIMKMDQNGNLWITDRLKEMIKYKGFQVAPSELEDVLLRHPDVTDAAVCAVYDNSQATEVPLAYVSLAAAHIDLPESRKKAVLDGIRDWVDSRVAGYKKLRGGVFHLQQLPKTNTGKILRKNLPAKLKEARETKL